VSSQEHDRGSHAALGEGSERSRRRGEPGGDTWNNLKLDARRREGLGLLAAPAEDEGIAALESDDVMAGAGFCDQEGFDITLRAAKSATLFSDVNAAR
jgi:hypothetical protein